MEALKGPEWVGVGKRSIDRGFQAAGMTELRDLSRGSTAASSARYSRLEGTDDSIRIKVRTLDNESTWEVDGEGSWTVRQLKDHVCIFCGMFARVPLCRTACQHAKQRPRTVHHRARPFLMLELRGATNVQLKETKDLKDKRIRLILLGRMLEVDYSKLPGTVRRA